MSMSRMPLWNPTRPAWSTRCSTRSPASSAPTSFRGGSGEAGPAMEVPTLEQCAGDIFRCHHPRKRMIQYVAAFVLDHWRRGVLDRPVKPGDDTFEVCDRGRGRGGPA